MYGNAPYGSLPYGNASTAPSDVVITPSVFSLTASVQSPIVAIDAVFFPSVFSLMMSVQSPVILIDVAVFPSPVSLVLSVPSPEVFMPLSPAMLRERPRLKPVPLAEIHLLNGGPVLYISDRNIDVGGQRYEDYIEEINGWGEEVRRTDSEALNSKLSVVFRNEKFKTYDHLIQIGQTYPFEGAEITLKEVYLDDDGTPSDAVTAFKGNLDAPRDIDLARFTCQVSSSEFAKDRSWQQELINTDEFPNAIEDLGEVIPIIYGDVGSVPALRVDWGAKTTLLSSISSSATSLSLSDGSRFPSSNFDLWIDDEKVHVGTRTENSCTVLSRAQGGTTATAHRAGATVWEHKSQYDSVLADGELHTVGDIFAEIDGELLRVTSGVSAVYTGGRHLLRATSQIKAQALKDDLTVSDNIAISVGGSVKTVYPSGASGSCDYGTTIGQVYDGSEDTGCNCDGAIGVSFPSTSYGTIDRQYIFITALFTLGNNTVSSPWSPSTFGAMGKTTIRVSKTGGNWGDSITITAGDSNMIVYEVWKEVHYTADTNKTGQASRGGSGLIATNTVDRFHAVVKGYKDDGAGTYTGTPNALIESVDDAIKHFLVAQLGYAMGDIDTTSFNAAGSSADSAGYALAFRLGEKITPSEFLMRMASESRTTLKYRAGKWYLNWLPDSAPAAVKTITKEELAGQFSKFKFNYSSIEDIGNDLEARYARNYSRIGGDSDWNGTVSASDATSISERGTYKKKFDFMCIRSATMAASVLAHKLKQLKQPWALVDFPVFWEHFDLVAGATVDIDNPIFDAKRFFIESIRRAGGELRCVGREWW